MSKKPIGGLTAAMLDEVPAPAPAPAAAPAPAVQPKETIAVTGRLSPDLYKRMKAYGVDTRKTTLDIITEALTEYLDKRGA